MLIVGLPAGLLVTARVICFRIVRVPVPIEFDRLRVVLVRARNPLNIGAAARAMSNFGFSHLRVVEPYRPAFRQARSAVGAADLLANAEEYDTVAEAVGDCTLVVGTTAVRKRNLMHTIRPLEQGARLLRKRLTSGTVALLFGSEKIGLTNKDFSHCHWLMRIPTCETNISMNLGQAVAVCLYEMARITRTAPETQTQLPASAELIERLNGVLFDALRASGYLQPTSPAPTEAKIRRRVRRMNLSTLDAEAWLGIFRQIIWKIRTEENRRPAPPTPSNT
jgi:tRNA/rRNA methyltransferase